MIHNYTVRNRNSRRDSTRRRVVASTASENFVFKLLDAHGIDTTLHHYTATISTWDYGDDYSSNRKIKFTANGDYLALFVIALKSKPTPDEVLDFFGKGEFIDIVESSPSVSELLENSVDQWNTNNVENYVFVPYLKNLDTGEVLQDIPEEGDEDEEDWG